jgi:hypothetical protein
MSLRRPRQILLTVTVARPRAGLLKREGCLFRIQRGLQERRRSCQNFRVGLTAAADEDFPFKNNVSDPLFAGKELPTFKFELEKTQGKVIGGSFGKEATVEQLPISKGATSRAAS